MIGTRTARTVVFGLLGIMAGLLFPVAGAARPLTATAVPVMRGPGTDMRTPDDLTRAAPTIGAGESEVRSGQPPVPATLPAGVAPHPTMFVLVALVVLGEATVVSFGPPGARAPPRLAL